MKRERGHYLCIIVERDENCTGKLSLVGDVLSSNDDYIENRIGKQQYFVC